MQSVKQYIKRLNNTFGPLYIYRKFYWRTIPTKLEMAIDVAGLHVDEIEITVNDLNFRKIVYRRVKDAD